MDGERAKSLINQGHTSPISGLQHLDREEYNYLSYLFILNEAINRREVLIFLAICGFVLTEDKLADFLNAGVTEGVLALATPQDEYHTEYVVEQRIRKLFSANLSQVEREERHRFADQFYRQIFVNVYTTIVDQEESTAALTLLSDDEVKNLCIRPGGLIDFGVHYPQAAIFYNWSLQRAFYWQAHLFEIKKFEDAADITNSICFALARKGYSHIAKEMLARNIGVTHGIYRVASLTNLATILREQQDHHHALNLYWRALWPLIRFGGILQLAAAFSEMSNIYRDRGQLFRALALQELSKILRFFLKDVKGRAICNNQLSILYRSFRLYSLALRASKSAENYWRSVEDIVNLAKTLVTQGNILNMMGRPQKALECFNESLDLNNRIENWSEVASSISGKARSYIQLRNFTQANLLLKEAIALRQRTGDHRIGIEYENMGNLDQKQGNLGLALRWYEKALPYLEKYQPGLSANCKRQIVLLQRQLK